MPEKAWRCSNCGEVFATKKEAFECEQWHKESGELSCIREREVENLDRHFHIESD